MIKSLVALFVIAVFTSFAVRSHYAAMLMYWWFGIFRPHEWMWWDLSALRLPLIATGIFLVPMILSGKLPAVRGSIGALMMLFLIVATVAGLLAGCVRPWPSSLATVLIIATVTLFTQQLINSPAKMFGALLLVSLSLDLVSAKAGVFATLGGKSLYDADIGGGGFTGTNAVALGTAMSIFFLVFCYQCIRRVELAPILPSWIAGKGVRKPLAWLIGSVIVGGVLFVVATESRGSALSLAAGVLIWVVLHPRRSRLLLVGCLVGGGALTVAGPPSGYVDRLGTAFVEEEDLDNSAAGRHHFWHVARLMAADTKTGVGVGCFQSYYDRYDDSSGRYGTRRSVHSSHMAVLAEIGYVGFAVWVLLLAGTFWTLWRVRRRCRSELESSATAWYLFFLCNALMAALVVFTLGGSFYEMPYNDYTWLLFGFAMATARMFESTRFEDMDGSVNGRVLKPVGSRSTHQRC